MALIQLDPDKIIDYVPLFDRKNTKDPLIVRCKYVPRKLSVAFSDVIARAIQEVSDRQKRVDIQRACDKEQFCKQVVEIKNFFDDELNEITDPAIFYDMVDTNLIFEILEAMVNQSILTEGQLKNLEPG
jgi:hypothetical protein